ncbi:MAG: CarD family transcriptional regulator [Rickettsiaceae bacterium]|nr:CarD family transcriptional regulator [Rickettsiaceae bacterium]
MSKNSGFKLGDKVVYPSHGVGEIINIESQTVADTKLEVYVISFPQDKMTLRVPVSRSTSSGLRTLATKTSITEVYNILNGKPKRGNKMWSRRAQEYEAKINSGELEAIAEVVRDLYKNVDNDRSYSERTIYESALNRLTSEIALLEKISEEDSTEKVVELLKEKAVAA